MALTLGRGSDENADDARVARRTLRGGQAEQAVEEAVARQRTMRYLPPGRRGSPSRYASDCCNSPRTCWDGSPPRRCQRPCAPSLGSPRPNARGWERSRWQRPSTRTTASGDRWPTRSRRPRRSWSSRHEGGVHLGVRSRRCRRRRLSPVPTAGPTSSPTPRPVGDERASRAAGVRSPGCVPRSPSCGRAYVVRRSRRGPRGAAAELAAIAESRAAARRLRTRTGELRTAEQPPRRSPGSADEAGRNADERRAGTKTTCAGCVPGSRNSNGGPSRPAATPATGATSRRPGCGCCSTPERRRRRVRRELALPAGMLRPADTVARRRPGRQGADGRAGDARQAARAAADPPDRRRLQRDQDRLRRVPPRRPAQPPHHRSRRAADPHASSPSSSTAPRARRPAARARGVRVLFSAPDEIADDLIRQLVAAEPAGRASWWSPPTARSCPTCSGREPGRCRRPCCSRGWAELGRNAKVSEGRPSVAAVDNRREASGGPTCSSTATPAPCAGRSVTTA